MRIYWNEDFLKAFKESKCVNCLINPFPDEDKRSFECSCKNIIFTYNERMALLDIIIGIYNIRALETLKLTMFEIYENNILIYSSDSILDMDVLNYKELEFNIETFLVFR